MFELTDPSDSRRRSFRVEEGEEEEGSFGSFNEIASNPASGSVHCECCASCTSVEESTGLVESVIGGTEGDSSGGALLRVKDNRRVVPSNDAFDKC